MPKCWREGLPVDSRLNLTTATLTRQYQYVVSHVSPKSFLLADEQSTNSSRARVMAT